MPDKLTCLADYLSYEEGILLYQELQENNISALVKSCGPPSIPFGEGLYFQLLVPEEDLVKSLEITKNLMPAIDQLRQKIKCPRCKSEAVFPVQTLGFWQRLYFAGTDVYTCDNCRKKFGK
jgi:DNA-directed RNA polymerase subunit RPC12/RpoP